MHMTKIDLTTSESLSNLPDSVREVFLASAEPVAGATRVNLSRLNPLKVAQEIDRICGVVDSQAQKIW